MFTDNAYLISCRLILLPTHSLIIDSQLTTHRLIELQLSTRKLREPQLATRKLLGSHFIDRQLTGCILELFSIKIAPRHGLIVTLATNNDFIQLGAE